MLGIGASGPAARSKTTRVFRRSLGPLPKTSPYLSGAQGLKVFRFRRILFRHTASQNGWTCLSGEQPAMPAPGNSSLHHPSCAQVQRQHVLPLHACCRFSVSEWQEQDPWLRFQGNKAARQYLSLFPVFRPIVRASLRHTPRLTTNRRETVDRLASASPRGTALTKPSQGWLNSGDNPPDRSCSAHRIPRAGGNEGTAYLCP